MKWKGRMVIRCWLALAGMAALFFSCDRDHLQEEKDDAVLGGKVGVHLTLNAPYSSGKIVRAGSQTVAECVITEIQVLVLENGYYSYRVGGEMLSFTDSTTTFQALLRSSSGPVTLLLLANADEDVSALLPSPGATRDELKEALIRVYAPEGETTGFPMYGEKTIAEGITATRENSFRIPVIRALARIDVALGESVDNFELLSVQAFRVADKICLIPADPGNLDSPSVTDATVPGDVTYVVNSPVFPVSENSFREGLYLPESVSLPDGEWETGATCLVIGGRYGGSGDTTYYRIDFTADPDRPGEILRNWRYEFTITDVGGSGWRTAEDASVNPSTEMVAEAWKWEDYTISMIFDGRHYFGVNTRLAQLGYRTGSTAYIEVETDFSSYELQWADANGTLLGSASRDSLKNGLFSIWLMESGQKIRIRAETATDSVGGENTAYLALLAGRWKVLIKIRQLIPPYMSDVVINVLNIGTGIGTLAGATTAYLGMKNLLLNPDNFGLRGKLIIGAIQIEALESTSLSFTTGQWEAILSGYDIINIAQDANPPADISAAVVNWLAHNEKRVLFINMGAKTGNSNVMNALNFPYAANWTNGGSTGNLDFIGYSQLNDYFTYSGPFGDVPADSASFVFPKNNATWSGINMDAVNAGNLIPLIVNRSYGTGGGVYVLSVDPEQRVVYVGDADFNNVQTSGLNSTGTIANNPGRIMANIWAWAIEKVLPVSYTVVP